MFSTPGTQLLFQKFVQTNNKENTKAKNLLWEIVIGLLYYQNITTSCIQEFSKIFIFVKIFLKISIDLMQLKKSENLDFSENFSKNFDFCQNLRKIETIIKRVEKCRFWLKLSYNLDFSQNKIAKSWIESTFPKILILVKISKNLDFSHDLNKYRI